MVTLQHVSVSGDITAEGILEFKCVSSSCVAETPMNLTRPPWFASYQNDIRHLVD